METFMTKDEVEWCRWQDKLNGEKCIYGKPKLSWEDFVKLCKEQYHCEPPKKEENS